MQIHSGENQMSTPIVVLNDDPLFFSIQYYDNGDPAKRAELEAQWLSFDRLDPANNQTYKIWSRPSNDVVAVIVDHNLPPNTPAGMYRVETFIPGRHATTQRAVFTIANQLSTDTSSVIQIEEAIVLVDMYNLYDVWYPLGEYYLDPPRHHLLGRVRQYDLSREFPTTEVSFGPVRWIPIRVLPGDRRRFDSPVGTEAEREAYFPTGRMIGRYPVWAGEWLDANPFLSWYTYGCHTGADLNLPGISSADKGKPIYSIGDGRVTYAGRAGTWGNIIVIEHPDGLVTYPDGTVQRQIVYSRYGHVDDQILVRAGQAVDRGVNIGFIGLAAGATSGWHLHFDISHTDLLKSRPAHWPDLTAIHTLRGGSSSDAYQNAQSSVMRQVLINYIDPLRFIKENHNA
jgi:murein DD-endopeptidase MepM/ murein hydrolase activator NlpD